MKILVTGAAGTLGQALLEKCRGRHEVIGVDVVEQVTRDYVDQTLLGRFVPTDDVAAMVAFLVSDEANNITGQTLEVSAGWRM